MTLQLPQAAAAAEAAGRWPSVNVFREAPAVVGQVKNDT